MKFFAIFIILSATLWYFHIDVRGFVDSHQGIKTSFEVVTSFLVTLWHNYLSSAASYIWHDVVIDIVWKNLAPLFGKIKG